MFLELYSGKEKGEMIREKTVLIDGCWRSGRRDEGWRYQDGKEWEVEYEKQWKDTANAIVIGNY